MSASTVPWFNVWLTATDIDFLNPVIGTLVKRGFSVGPLGRTLVLNYGEKPVKMIALMLLRSPRNDDERETYNATGVHDEVVNVLKVLGVKYLSIVVSCSADCTWNVGNYTHEDDKKAKDKVN